MHTLGHELAKQTIAEQMETEEVLTCLKEMGVVFAGLLAAQTGALAGGLIT